jgi:type IV secretion system protein VirB5
MASAYTDAWRPWDERMADHVIAKRNWQIAFGAIALVALALTVAVVWLSSRIRYVAYVVEVDRLGYAVTQAQPLTPQLSPDAVTRMMRYEVALYIREARSVSNDPGVEQQQLNALLAHTVKLSAADRFLDAYYHNDHAAKNPFVTAMHRTVNVQIESILPLSAKTWEVRWQEEVRDLNGAELGAPTHWEAQLTTELITPKDSDSILSNPLGFYISAISWTEAQNQ